MTKIGIMRGKTEVMKMAEIFQNFFISKGAKIRSYLLKI